MIFNKDNKGNEELRTLTGSYYKSNDFDKISVKVLLSSEDLINLIGQELFDRAENHYLSDNYLRSLIPDPPAAEGSGSGGVGLQPPDYPFLDKLVQYIQLPIAFQSAFWHFQGNDISHEDSGRKVKIDKNSESIAWEWQYDRDDAAALRNYQRAYDRLIRFLNTNAKKLPEWTNSDAKKNSLNLFINTSDHFNRLFAIDDSSVFFLRLAPIMREVERKYIKQILGTDKFNELKELLKSGEEIEDEDQELLDFICDPIPLITMSLAVKRFSVTVIPEGVVQNFISQRQNSKASLPTTIDLVNDISESLLKDGMFSLNQLKKYYSAHTTDVTDETITEFIPIGKISDKFFGL